MPEASHAAASSPGLAGAGPGGAFGVMHAAAGASGSGQSPPGGAAGGRGAAAQGGQEPGARVDDYIGTSIAGATMLGQLRRFMLRCAA